MAAAGSLRFTTGGASDECTFDWDGTKLTSDCKTVFPEVQAANICYSDGTNCAVSAPTDLSGHATTADLRNVSESISAISARVAALEITATHLVHLAGYEDTAVLAAAAAAALIKCTHMGVEYAQGDTVSTRGCPTGCGVQHPCLIKSYGGFTAAEKDTCMGAGAGGNKVEDLNSGEIFSFVRDTQCNSNINWARPGEEAYSRTNPCAYITDVLHTVAAHGSGYPKGMVDTHRDRYAICRTGSSQSSSSSYDLLDLSSGAATQAFDRCKDFRMGSNHVHSHPTTCIADGEIRQTAAGQGFKMQSTAQCTGPAIAHPKTASLHGAFSMYSNKGPMANSKHSNNEQWFNPADDALVTGFEAAKSACLASMKCGGISKAHGSLTDQYYVNSYSQSTYAADGYGPRLGNWVHDFSTSTGYDVWVREGFTMEDVLSICEETASCECISITNKDWSEDQQYFWDHSWSMHSSTATSSAASQVYAITTTTEAATLPQITGGSTIVSTCTLGDDGSSAVFVAAASTASASVCVPNCASA